MKKSGLLVLAAVAVIAVGGGVYFLNGQHSGSDSSSSVTAWVPDAATPSGVTLQYLQTAKTKAGFFAFGITQRGDHIVYADPTGHPLYTYDKDAVPGQSTCNDDCAKAWPAAMAPANAKPTGAWTLVDHQGAKQWAFRGKPLYTCAKDVTIGETASCNGAGEGVWHAATFTPSANMPIPEGLALDDVSAAPGQVLIDSRKMTLYVFGGDVKHDKPACAAGMICTSPWVPVAAAALALPQGDFTAVVRDDGTRQWSYKGRALYSYSGDVEPGDTFGAKVDPRFAVATAQEYFMPANTSIRRTYGQADLLADGKGMTLYKRDESFQLVTGHGLPHSIPGIPAMGRAIGTKGCDSECLKVWHPFVAPADAVPSGFWKIAVRDDGTRQWVYKDYALYTYSGDSKPGDIIGDQIYDVAIDDGKHPEVTDLVPTTNAAALYWAFIEP